LGWRGLPISHAKTKDILRLQEYPEYIDSPSDTQSSILEIGEKNMKSKKYFIGLLALLISTSLACGLIDTAVNKATGGDNMQTVASLWSDVPQMDGLEASQIDMPPFVKLAVRLIIGNMGRLNPEGQDQTTGMIDWIVFTSDKTPEDVQNYYTNDLMTSNGWDSSESAPCVSGSTQGAAQVGVICAFTKTQDGKNVQLAILTAEDEKTKKNNIFFLRLEESATPVPAPTQ
jgi:hypothetical protein